MNSAAGSFVAHAPLPSEPSRYISSSVTKLFIRLSRVFSSSRHCRNHFKNPRPNPPVRSQDRRISPPFYTTFLHFFSLFLFLFFFSLLPSLAVLFYFFYFDFLFEMGFMNRGGAEGSAILSRANLGAFRFNAHRFAVWFDSSSFRTYSRVV